MVAIKLQEGADSSLLTVLLMKAALLQRVSLPGMLLQSDEDDGSTYRQLCILSSLLSIYEYDYSVMSFTDMRIEEIRLLNADEDIIQTWSSSMSLHEVLKTNTIPLNEDDNLKATAWHVLQVLMGMIF